MLKTSILIFSLATATIFASSQTDKFSIKEYSLRMKMSSCPKDTIKQKNTDYGTECQIPIKSFAGKDLTEFKILIYKNEVISVRAKYSNWGNNANAPEIASSMIERFGQPTSIDGWKGNKVKWEKKSEILSLNKHYQTIDLFLPEVFEEINSKKAKSVQNDM